MKQKEICCDCGKILSKDEVALNKKLISIDVTSFQCLSCMSIDMECEADDLQVKIDEFREQGCSLFL